MDSQDTLREGSQPNNLEPKDCQPDCTTNCEDIVAKSTNGSIELLPISNSQPAPVCSLGSCMDITESLSVNPVVDPILKLSPHNVSSKDKNINSVVTLDLEVVLQNVLNNNSQGNDTVKISANGSMELQTSSSSQPMSATSPQSYINTTETSSANTVVTPVLEVSLQNVSSQNSKVPPSTIISTVSPTPISCDGDKTGSEMLMDVSSSDKAVIGSGIPESSSQFSDVVESGIQESSSLCNGVIGSGISVISSLSGSVGSSTCPYAEGINGSVDINCEVQRSDLSTISDTQQLVCGDQQRLNQVSLQADEPVIVISDKINSSIDDCSISQLPSESLEDVKEQIDKMECEDDKVKSSTDESSVAHLPTDCLQTNPEDGSVMDEKDQGEIKTDIDNSVSVENNIKQEPYDPEYERSDLIYRSGPIVVDSDDDSSVLSINEVGDSDKDVADEEEVVEPQKATAPVSHGIIRTEGEVFPEELSPLEYLTISPDASVVLETLGTVSGIVGVLVIVKANPCTPALYDDTVLFLEGRQPLGLIFEIFGTVEQPYYSVRFNANKDIQDKGITIGDKVFFAPKADNLTKYVFIAELRKIRCDDASWENDNEPPPAHLEYSDDEKERQAKQQQKNKDRGKEETHDTSVRRKKRKKKPSPGFERDPNGPQLLQGDLNRNPFENKNQTFSQSAKPRWPRSVGNGHNSNHRPRFSPQMTSQPQPRPSSFGAFRNQWPPQSEFAERQGWNHQPGLLGRIPDTATNGSPDRGNFRSNNFSSHHVRQPHPGFGNAPFPPPPSHSARGPNPHQSQNFFPPQANRFETYFPQGNPEHMNTFAPPPGLQHQNHRSPGFPMFSPSHPPPIVNSMFNQHQPQHRPTYKGTHK